MNEIEQHQVTNLAVRHYPQGGDGRFQLYLIFKQPLALHTVKGGSRSAGPPPQATANSALLNIPPHYVRPFFNNANKAEGSDTDGFSSAPLNGCENGVESVDGLMSELFGDDDDMVVTGNDVPQPSQLHYKLQETDFEETEDCDATAANNCSSAKRTRLDLTISLPPTSAAPVASAIEAKESKPKRKRNDETEDDLKDGAARAQSRAKFDSGVPGTLEAAAAITAYDEHKDIGINKNISNNITTAYSAISATT